MSPALRASARFTPTGVGNTLRTWLHGGCERFTPTGVGKTLHDAMRGIVRRRFTPTGVGNTRASAGD